MSLVQVKLGNVTLHPCGAYSAEKGYKRLDFVTYKNGSYFCIADRGTTITGIEPKENDTSEFWQLVSMSGTVTPEFLALHDHVINTAEQVAADAEFSEEARTNIEGMQTNIQELQRQVVSDAEETKRSKDAAAGYASTADASRRAAKQSEENAAASVTGFDVHVAEKVTDAEKSIEQARLAANRSVVAQQEESVQNVKNQGGQFVDAKKAEALKEIKAASDQYDKDRQADIQAVTKEGEKQIQAIEQKVNKLNTDVQTAVQVNNTLVDNTKAASDLNDTLVQNTQAAETLKNNLDASVNTANDTAQAVHAENATASSNLEELRSENFNSQEILSGVADLRAYLGLSDADIFGVQVDYKNKTFTRIAGAVNMTAGADFDNTFYGGIRNCIVSDDGNIVAWYGDENYTEDGSLGQVMTYYPKFYYLVCPVVYDPIDTGVGYHLRKANYYVSEKARPGFKLHPAFYDANGNEVDFILRGVYEGSIFDSSADAYLMNDEQVADFNTDKFCSIAGTKPASGLTQNLTRPNVEQLAKNRGDGFHSESIKTVSMIQLLMLVEYASMNTQTAVGQGVVSISDNSAYNCSSLTGSTSGLGNGSGRAAQTVNEKGGATTTETADGKTSVRYRGCENIWGNIWKFIYGVNIWGNGKMGGGQPFICSDFNYAESKNSGNYEAAGFTMTNVSGYISAMGYSPRFDWLFMASECLGNSSLPVGDYTYVTANLNGYRIALLGGPWNNGSYAGAFCWNVYNGVSNRYRNFGGRLVFIPTRDSESYIASIASWKQQLAA